MSTSDFQFDKDYIADRYKTFVNQVRSRDDGYDPNNAKEVEYSKFQILQKIKELYQFVLENQKLAMRRALIHNDRAFVDLYNKVKSHIQNKIRSSGQGTIYLRVNGFVTFTGDKDQYEEFVLENQTKQDQLMRKIVEELNSVINGDVTKDDNKPVLMDIKEEEFIDEPSDVDFDFTSIEFVDYVLDDIDDKIIKDAEDGKPESFNEWIREKILSLKPRGDFISEFIDMYLVKVNLKQVKEESEKEITD